MKAGAVSQAEEYRWTSAHTTAANATGQASERVPTWHAKVRVPGCASAYRAADSVAWTAGSASTYSIQLVIISSSLLSPQRIDWAGSGLARLFGLLS